MAIVLRRIPFRTCKSSVAVAQDVLFLDRNSELFGRREIVNE